VLCPFLIRPGCTLVFSNIHILPNWIVVQRKELIDDLHSVIPDPSRCAHFALGDFNFGFDECSSGIGEENVGSSCRDSLSVERH